MSQARIQSERDVESAGCSFARDKRARSAASSACLTCCSSDKGVAGCCSMNPGTGGGTNVSVSASAFFTPADSFAMDVVAYALHNTASINICKRRCMSRNFCAKAENDHCLPERASRINPHRTGRFAGRFIIPTHFLKTPANGLCQAKLTHRLPKL